MAYMKYLRGYILIIAISLCLPAVRTYCGELSEEHIDIWLRNEAGDTITPSYNAADPYSPKKTCGACHQYFIITRGEHFQQGSPGARKGPGNAYLPAELVHNDPRPEVYGGFGAYDWIAGNGDYHPGGGLLEEIRLNYFGYPPSTLNYLEGEKQKPGVYDPNFKSRLTPDSRSHFRTSGVLEADCLMCHMEGYDLERRNAQIRARNYRWAATAGAGLGEILGQVFSPGDAGGVWNFSSRPVVKYNWDSVSFTEEGKLSGKAVNVSVSSRACLQCHGEAQAFNTGTLHRSEDSAHEGTGFVCTDCHGLATDIPGGRLSHRIGRDASAGNAQTTGMKSCADCHLGGLYSRTRKEMPEKAPNALLTHADIFYNASFHLRLLSCTACHVTSQPARGAYLLDLSIGKTFWYTADNMDAITDPEEAANAARKPWKPWIAVVDLMGILGERYVPAALHTAQFFGERGPGGEISPIELPAVSRAFQHAKGITTVKVRNPAGKEVPRATVATKADIEIMLKAFEQLGRPGAVFVSDKIYEFKEGKLTTSDLPFNTTVEMPLWHNITPIAKKQTLGAAGCTDCHDKTSLFFTKLKVKNVGGFLKEDYPNPKKPNAAQQMRDWGYKRVPSYE